MNQAEPDSLITEITKTSDKKITLCLNMIVRNEEKTICKMLESIIKYIDYYVVIDFGSTDKTIEHIKEIFDNNAISGEIYFDKFKNFATNKTEALKLAKGKSDYIIVLDADQELKILDSNFKKNLFADIHNIYTKKEGLEYIESRIIKGDIDAEYLHYGGDNMMVFQKKDIIKDDIDISKIYVNMIK